MVWSRWLMAGGRYDGGTGDVALRALNLCDGYGGFELAWRHLGIDVSTVGRVERDAYAAAVLVERMETARLDSCPVWDDLESFDGRAWRGRVDLVAAGFPCPDFSSAGRRVGVDGEHWLWPEVERVVRDVGPRWVVLENVPGVVRLGGATRVLCDLADLGFDAEWGLFAASSVGAPHERERWWCVARLADADEQGFGGVGDFCDGARVGVGRDVDGCDGASVADADDGERLARRDARPRRGRGSASRPLRPVEGRDADVGDAGGAGRSEVAGGADGDARAARRRSDRDHVADRAIEDVEHAGRARRQGARFRRHESAQSGGWPPGRDDVDGWREWIAAGGPQPVLRRDLDGPPDGLADALHLGGNGLVPQAAAEAIQQLCTRAGWVLT